GAQPAAVAAVGDLGLVRGHVDAGRAVGAARLAGQAQVERLLDLGGVPAAHERAVGELLQHAGAAAGGVLLVPGREVGRAHEAAGGGGVGAALADADAPVHRGGEVAAVVREREAAGHHRERAGVRAAQVLRDTAGAHDHTRVEPVLGVEEALDLLHQTDRLGRVDVGQQLAACAAVAVLARERAAVAGDQRGGVVHEVPEHRAAARPVERQVDPHVDAAVAEVPVGQAGDAVAVEQRVEVAQVGTEPLGRHGGVLPAGPRLRPGRRAPGQAGAVGPDLPDPAGLGTGGQDADRAGAGVGRERLGVGERLLL